MDMTKITYFTNQLKGDALRWASLGFCIVWYLVKGISPNLRPPFAETNAIKRHLGLTQGWQPVPEYALKFCILATHIGWKKTALQDTLLNYLSDPIKEQITAWNKPEGFDKLIELAVSIDEWFWEWRREQNYNPHNHFSSGFTTSGEPCAYKHPVVNYKDRDYKDREQLASSSPPLSSVPVKHLPAFPELEPMQNGQTSLTPEEKQRCKDSNSCIYYGNSCHYLANCPLWGNKNTRQ